jgi:hypothetical protein
MVPRSNRELVAEGLRTKSTANLIMKATPPSASATKARSKTPNASRKEYGRT